MHMSHGRRWIATGLALMALGAAGVSSCAHHVPAKLYPVDGRTNCNKPYNAHAQPIPLPADVATLQTSFPGCLSEIAAIQFQDLVTSPDNNAKQTVPADPKCWAGDATTELRVAEYTGAGRLNGLSYGHGNATGYIVGRIENVGRCATAGNIVIPAKSVVLWIIERTEPQAPLLAHLVYDGSEMNLGGHVDWELGECNHSGRRGDKAKFKSKVCDDSAAGTPGENVSTGSAQAILRVPLRLKHGRDDAGLWLVCGADCCYTTTYI